MHDYKLIKLVQVLTSKELTGLERYLTTPLINTNAEVSKLFTQLCKYHPAFDYPKLSKEWLYTKLYGKAPYDDGKMRKLMTQLTQLIQQFLVSKELDASEDIKAKLLARSLAGRQNYDLFLDVVDARLKELDKGVQRGRDYFREGYELSEMLYYHPGSGKLNKSGEYYDKAISDLERYFTLVMLQNEADNVIRTRLVREKGDSAYLDVALQIAGKREFASINAILFFRKIIMLLKGEMEESLDELREAAFITFGQLNRFEQDFAMNLLRNYAVPMSNNGSIMHRRFMLDLYEVELERGLASNTIGSTAFMNIVTLGLSIEELDWVTQFISRYGDYLPEKEREITLNYCKGMWHYRRGLKSGDIEDYYEGLKCLSLIPIRTGPKYELRVRPIMLRIQFEVFIKGKETLEELLGQVRNFERHLTGNDEYSEPIRESYIIFLRYFKLLARLATQRDKEKRIDDFVAKLSSEKDNVAHKSWLSNRVEELINSN